MRRALSVPVALAVLFGHWSVASAHIQEADSTPPVYTPATPGRAVPGDATVVAVIDDTFSPYHWDYLAAKMPQAIDGSDANDLPLDTAPHHWLAGFPKPSVFDSYRSLELSLEDKDPLRPIPPLDEADAGVWEGVRRSTRREQNLYWIPGTKVIGALDFGGNKIHGPSSSHGTGASSVAVGNIHGTCPECVLVFISYSDQPSAEAALDWAMKQPWIDAITNSYGFSATPATRDRLYSGSNTQLQKEASLRGQTIFFSAGNGIENRLLVPNSTLLSSQEGPDWLVTVGAVSPDAHASYTGHGKPVDIAGIGAGYPSAYESSSVGGSGPSGFGGTSNSTPQVAGIYARALYLVRAAMSGTSRMQSRGVIARGPGADCAAVRRRCELRDGRLTAGELRTRLFHGAVHTDSGMTPAGVGSIPVVADEEYLNEGHGTYLGRVGGPAKGDEWMAEFERLVGPLFGRTQGLKRPGGERRWHTVVSFCRQHLWGRWNGGYYKKGVSKLPDNDPLRWPMRSSIQTSCPALRPPP